MTGSFSRTNTYTLTDARYVGAKIGADLRMLNSLYGRPGLTDIPDYVEEAAILLNDGYLGTVDFGFKSGDAWKLRLRYTSTLGGQLMDNRPGLFPTAADVDGLSFYSYLSYSAKWELLDVHQRQRVESTPPVKRQAAAEPTAAVGSSISGHGYGRNGVGVSRHIYTA